MKQWMFVFFLLFSFHSFALEIDEKLTMRILRVSESKKTVLINRGVEDGLAEGDHAKFFTTVGVVARAVVSKVSPTRSVWSVYRLVNPEYINEDTVMNLKISSAVKVSEDDSKMIIKEPIATEVSKSNMDRVDIPLAEGAEDLEQTAAEKSDTDELASLGGNLPLAPVTLVRRNWEVWSVANLNIISGSTEASNGVKYDAEQSNIDFFLGGEYYFQTEDAWYSRFSLSPFYHSSSYNLVSIQGGESEYGLTEFGAGVSWHPFAMPSETNKLIPFAQFTFAVGTVKNEVSTTIPASGLTPASTGTDSWKGSSNSFSIGAGIKYYLPNAFGARAILDYYGRNDTYENDSAISYDGSWSGIRIFAGLSYRW